MYIMSLKGRRKHMKNSKNLIIAIILILIVAAGTAGYLYARTDMFKSEKVLFYKYLAKTKLVDDETKQVLKSTSDNMNSNNYSSTGNIACSMASNDTSTNIANVQQLFTIKYNTLENRNLNQSYADYNLVYNNQNMITVRYLKDQNLYALKADNVVDKYLALENKNLKAFFAKLGVEDTSSIPDEIPQKSTDVLDSIDPSVLETVKTKYLPIINNKLTSDKFSKATNEDKTISLTLSLSEQDVKDIEKTLLENLKNDEVTINEAIKMMAQAGYHELNTDSFKTMLQEEIDEIANGTYGTNPGYVTLTVVENGRETTGLELRIRDTETQVQSTYKIDLSEKNTRVITTDDGKENKGKVVLTFGHESNKLDVNADVYSIDATNVEKALGNLKYQLTDYATSNIKQNADVSVMVQDTVKIQLNFAAETDVKQDVQIEKITDANAIRLNDMSTTDLQDLFGKIQERLEYLYSEKLAEAMAGASQENATQNASKSISEQAYQQSLEDATTSTQNTATSNEAENKATTNQTNTTSNVTSNTTNTTDNESKTNTMIQRQ